MGTVIAAVSGKGGTGKTSLCANTAVSLCALGERVLLIDADAGLRNLDLVLGMTDRLLFSYADVLAGRASLKSASVPHHGVKNLRILTAPGEIDSAPPDGLNALLELCRRHFAFTLIDCPAGLGANVLEMARLADRAIAVATPDSASLRGAQSTAIALGDVGQQNAKLVINRVRRRLIRRGLAAGIDTSMDAVGLPLLGAVPEDDDVLTSANRGEVLLLSSTGPAARAYMNIARRLTGERVRLFEGMKRF